MLRPYITQLPVTVAGPRRTYTGFRIPIRELVTDSV